MTRRRVHVSGSGRTGSPRCEPAEPGGRQLVLRVLGTFVWIESLLALPILIYPDGTYGWDWRGPLLAAILAIVTLAVLLRALVTSETNDRGARALVLLGALIGLAAILVLVATAYVL